MTAPRIPTELVAPLFSPKTFASPQQVDALLKKLRDEYPLAIAEVPGYDPHWIVTRWEDLREITRQDEIFHSNDHSKSLVTQMGQQMIEAYSGGKPNILETLFHMDPPVHAAYRAVAAPLFMPQAIAKREEFVRGLAQKYVDKMIANGPALDFAKEIAFLYPLEVVLSVVGVPESEHAHILELAQWFFNYADPDLMRPGANPMDPDEVIKTWTIVWEEFQEYSRKLTSERKTCPRDDVLTVLANAQVNGCPMSHSATSSYLLILGTAGHDTTAATTAVAMWVLAEQPELLARLKANPKDIPKFIDEAVRWTCPVKHFIRSAAQDYELSGQTIKKGDLIYLSYMSANRDESVFEDPYTFNIDRAPNRHIGFGYGGHICLGQHLARMELRVFWETLLPRLESVSLDGVPKMAESEFVGGPKSVPIRFKAA